MVIFPGSIIVIEPDAKVFITPGRELEQPIYRNRLLWTWCPTILEVLHSIKGKVGLERKELALSFRRLRSYRTDEEGLSERPAIIPREFLNQCSGKQKTSDLFAVTVRDQVLRRMEEDLRDSLRVFNLIVWAVGGLIKILKKADGLSEEVRRQVKLFSSSIFQGEEDLAKQLIACLASIVNLRKDAAMKQLYPKFTDDQRKLLRTALISSKFLFEMDTLTPLLAECKESSKERSQRILDSSLLRSSRHPLEHKEAQKRVSKPKAFKPKSSYSSSSSSSARRTSQPESVSPVQPRRPSSSSSSARPAGNRPSFPAAKKKQSRGGRSKYFR